MVKISADSAADLGGLFEQYKISVMPLSVLLDGESRLDGVDACAEDIFEAYETKKVLPKTGARSPEQFEEYFRALRADGSEVVHYAMSSKLSSTYNNAAAAAEKVGGVHVVDSLSLCSCIGLLAIYGTELAAQGATADEIVRQSLEKRGKLRVTTMIDSMEFLYRGGRCSFLKNLLVTVLKIHPVIAVNNGSLSVAAKFLGSMEKNVGKYAAVALKNRNPDLKRAVVAHALATPAVIQATVDAAKRAGFEQIDVIKAGTTIASHTGKGAIGLLFMEK